MRCPTRADLPPPPEGKTGCSWTVEAPLLLSKPVLTGQPGRAMMLKVGYKSVFSPSYSPK